MRSDNKIKNVSIKLVSIDFVPSWETTDLDNGTAIFHSSIGQKYIDTKDLPIKLQKQLERICKQAIEEGLGLKK